MCQNVQIFGWEPNHANTHLRGQGRRSVNVSFRNSLPLLVIVSGAPGSGKSTLARLIGDLLHIPVIHRDSVKTGMHVTVNSVDPGEVHRFAEAAFSTTFATAEVLLNSGTSVIVEAAFHSGASRVPLLDLVSRSRATHVRCHTDKSIAVARYTERAARGERHPAHADASSAERMSDPAFAWDVYDIELDSVATIDVDTTFGYDPTLDAIMNWISSAS